MQEGNLKQDEHAKRYLKLMWHDENNSCITTSMHAWLASMHT